MPSGNVDICRLDRPVDIAVGKCLSANAERARTRHRGVGIRRERGRRPAPGDGWVGDDGGGMHGRVLHRGGRETRGVSLGACPDRSTGGRPGRFFRSSVMPGLVPLLSGLTWERALCRQARPSPPLRCHPGPDPGSRLVPDPDPGKAGRGRCLWLWTPDQVRGDNRGTRTARDGGPQSVSRSGGRAGNPPVPTPCTRSTEVKPDSNGTSPGMTHGTRQGGVAGNEKGRRHLRRPHFPTVGNMGRFMSRVKSIFLS